VSVDAEKLWAEISQELSTSIKTSAPGMVHAPSPWHAALFLDSIDMKCSMPTVTKSSTIDGRGELIKSAGHILKFVHRGQRNGSLRLLPTIKREGVDQQAEQNSAALLGHVMREYTGYVLRDWEVPRLSPDVFISTAQHYGIKTNLIDFTPDAAVAVFFANKERPDSPHTEDAAVFSLELLANKRLDHLRVILPPPSTERLYLQRGIFIESNNDVTDICLKVTFKPDKSFQLVRKGSAIDIEPVDPSLLKAVEFAQHNASKYASIPKQEAPLREDLAAQGLHEVFAEGRFPKHSVDEMANWYYGFVDVLNWLAGFCTEQSGRLNLHSAILDLVCTSNPELVEWAIAFMTIQQQLLKQSPVLDQRALAVLEAAIYNLTKSRQNASQTAPRS
jgi:hypothetical protein